MFLELFLFEIKYRLKRVSTYVYFAIWFFMAFFTGSLFFMVGAFTRKQMVVYLQGIILFAIYLIGVVYSKFGLNVQRDELPLATDEWNRRQISEA